MTVTPVAQGVVTLSASPGGSYLVGPGGSAVSTPRERQSVASTADLVRLDREVKEAAVEFLPQKTPIKWCQKRGFWLRITKTGRYHQCLPTILIKE